MGAVLIDFLVNKWFILFNKCFAKYIFCVKRRNNTTNHKSNTPLIVVIPVVEKDLMLLEKCIAAVKCNCLHSIEKIVVVAPKNEKIINLLPALEVCWLDETLLQPISKEQIFAQYNNSKRNGWIYQQFLKLNIDSIFPNSYCLVVDVDAVLLQKQVFVKHGKCVLKNSDEYHLLYRKINQQLLGTNKLVWKSFIAHHQIIDTQYLTEMKERISKRLGGNFWQNLLQTIAKNDGWFSEYELYGNYMNLYHSNLITTIYWNNLDMKQQHFSQLNFEVLAKKYSSVSLHNYEYAHFQIPKQ